MNHEERVKIASKVTEMMVNKYGDEILLGGIFGSTAKGTDTEYSDLEMFFITGDKSKAKSLEFAYKAMPVTVVVEKVTEVEKDITEIDLNWSLKMGRLFNLKVACGDVSILKRFKRLLESVSQGEFNQFVARQTPLCYEELGRLKAVKTRGNTHETGLFVFEILYEFTLLIAIFNREFINYDYLGSLDEAFKFKRLPKDYETIAKRLLNWTSLSLEEIINLAERFVDNFKDFMTQNGIKIEEHTPLEKLEL